MLRNGRDGVDMNKWISVEDKWPDHLEWVLYYLPGDEIIAVGQRERINGHWYTDLNRPIDGITHWMLLPDKPE